MKLKLVDKLKRVEVDSLDSYIAVVDMGFIWLHLASQHSIM